MQHLAARQGFNWQVDSAGTGGWHVGEGPDRRSVRVAWEHGIDISGQVCRQFSKSDFELFDHIFVMDKYNLSDVQAMAPDALAIAKVKLLLGTREVPDPYYENEMFEPVFKLIEDGCEELIRILAK